MVYNRCHYCGGEIEVKRDEEVPAFRLNPIALYLRRKDEFMSRLVATNRAIIEHIVEQQ